MLLFPVLTRKLLQWFVAYVLGDQAEFVGLRCRIVLMKLVNPEVDQSPFRVRPITIQLT